MIVARWLAAHPRVLLLNDPTRGVDLGAKRDLYRVLEQLAADGVAVVMLSTELDEHVELMDRVLVFREGAVAAEIERRDLSRAGLDLRLLRPGGSERNMRGDLLARLRARPWGFALLVAVALLIANIIARSSFAAWSSWPATLADFAPFALAAMATTPAVLSGAGGIDISIGPLLNLVSVVVVGVLIPHGLGSIWVAVPIALALGALVGAINGILVGVFRYQAVLATLCGLFVLGGIGLAVLSAPASGTTGWLDRPRQQGRSDPRWADPHPHPGRRVGGARAHHVPARRYTPWAATTSPPSPPASTSRRCG